MKIQYNENIVLFIDVLGFSNLVYDKDQQRIENYFSYILNDFSKFFSKNRFKYLLISDSIVVSCKSSKENLGELIFVISKIQHQLLLKGILMRGAISVGNLYINKSNNVIVGPGLINAYKLEKLAKYPRIIIDRKLITKFFESTHSFMAFINIGFKKRFGQEDGNLKFDEKLNDGWLYVNYLRRAAFHGATHTAKNRKFLINYFKSSYFIHEYFEKINWLLKEFLEELSVGIKYYSSHPEFKTSKLRIKHITTILESLSRL